MEVRFVWFSTSSRLKYWLPSTHKFPLHSASWTIESKHQICFLFFKCPNLCPIYIFHLTYIHRRLSFTKHGPKSWKCKDSQSLPLTISQFSQDGSQGGQYLRGSEASWSQGLQSSESIKKRCLPSVGVGVTVVRPAPGSKDTWGEC